MARNLFEKLRCDFKLTTHGREKEKQMLATILW